MRRIWTHRLAGAALAISLVTLASVFGAAQGQVAGTDRALIGAIDIHAHLDPDGYGPGNNGRSLDVFELAELAKAAGMRGFVIKQHYDQSADSAYLARKLYPDLEIFGGIGTNFATGGLNPQAIRQMADVKGGWGRIVWMPTWDAHHYVINHGNDRPFINVARNGELLPEAKAVIAMVAEVNGKTRGSNGRVVLATGHNSPEEGLLMVAEGRRLGLEVVVTHPLLESVGMNLEQMQKAVAMGAYLEFVSGFVRQQETIEEHAEVIRTIGPEHCIISSDRGQGRGPEGHEGPAMSHVEGLAAAARALREHGFTERELDIMFKENPARLLGLPVL
jgi:Family of unknown function (DUF6282)